MNLTFAPPTQAIISVASKESKLGQNKIPQNAQLNNDTVVFGLTRSFGKNQQRGVKRAWKLLKRLRKSKRSWRTLYKAQPKATRSHSHKGAKPGKKSTSSFSRSSTKAKLANKSC